MLGCLMHKILASLEPLIERSFCSSDSFKTLQFIIFYCSFSLELVIMCDVGFDPAYLCSFYKYTFFLEILVHFLSILYRKDTYLGHSTCSSICEASLRAFWLHRSTLDNFVVGACTRERKYTAQEKQE